MLRSVLLINVIFIIFLTNTVFAIDAKNVPKDQRSKAGLYFSAQEASDYMEKHAKSTLFVDVRDPGEIFTVGMSVAVDANVPFKRINATKWDAKKKTFGLDLNPRFVKMLEAQRKAKHLSKKDTIILICGSGLRSAGAANALSKVGYTRVYSVVDGFGGWKRDNQEWTKKLNRKKLKTIK